MQQLKAQPFLIVSSVFSRFVPKECNCTIMGSCLMSKCLSSVSENYTAGLRHKNMHVFMYFLHLVPGNEAMVQEFTQIRTENKNMGMRLEGQHLLQLLEGT